MHTRKIYDSLLRLVKLIMTRAVIESIRVSDCSSLVHLKVRLELTSSLVLS